MQSKMNQPPNHIYATPTKIAFLVFGKNTLLFSGGATKSAFFLNIYR